MLAHPFLPFCTRFPTLHQPTAVPSYLWCPPRLGRSRTCSLMTSSPAACGSTTGSASLLTVSLVVRVAFSCSEENRGPEPMTAALAAGLLVLLFHGLRDRNISGRVRGPLNRFSHRGRSGARAVDRHPVGGTVLQLGTQLVRRRCFGLCVTVQEHLDQRLTIGHSPRLFRTNTAVG